MLRRIALMLALSALIPLSLSAEVQIITDEQLPEIAAQGHIIDIRPLSKIEETGVIKGSHVLTLFNEEGYVDGEKWLKKLKQITTQEQPIILISQDGNNTLPICNILSGKEGFKKVYNLQGGISEWVNEQNETIPFESTASEG